MNLIQHPICRYICNICCVYQDEHIHILLDYNILQHQMFQKGALLCRFWGDYTYIYQSIFICLLGVFYMYTCLLLWLLVLLHFLCSLLVSFYPLISILSLFSAVLLCSSMSFIILSSIYFCLYPVSSFSLFSLLLSSILSFSFISFFSPPSLSILFILHAIFFSVCRYHSAKNNQSSLYIYPSHASQDHSSYIEREREN